MVKRSAGHTTKDMSISAMGKMSEATGVPQPQMKVKHSVMDGIVKGVERGVHTPMVDGLIRTACSHKTENGIHAVKPSATKVATQQFGSVM